MIPFRVILLFWRSLYSEMTRSTFLGVGEGADFDDNGIEGKLARGGERLHLLG